MEIVALGPGDEDMVMAASGLFDGPASRDASGRFLSQPNHHLLVAYDEGSPAGFVSGIEMTHPDKGTEMFLLELGVAEPFRRQGIGRSLVDRLAEVARSRGCYGMWVLTDEDNAAAMATYRSSGTTETEATTLLSWTLNPKDQPPA